MFPRQPRTLEFFSHFFFVNKHVRFYLCEKRLETLEQINSVYVDDYTFRIELIDIYLSWVIF